MIEALLVGLLIASPPPECTVRLQTTAKAIAGLRINDDVIVRMKRVVAAMSRHEASVKPGSVEHAYAARLATTMDHNISLLQQIAGEITTTTGAPDSLSAALNAAISSQSVQLAHVKRVLNARAASSSVPAGTGVYRSLLTSMTSEAHTTDRRENELANAVRTQITACGGVLPQASTSPR